VTDSIDSPSVNSHVAKGKTYILLTGATGLVGRYLLRDLILRNQRVAVIARPTSKLSARQRVESIMQYWEKQLEKSLPRPIVIEGDICSEGLGLAERDARWISENCVELIHNAAILKFEATTREDEPFRTNLSGTRNVLEFAKLRGIPDFHYVSTAYVCGKTSDVVTEDQLDTGQELRNDYEQSKFDAETLVQAAEGFRNVTIFRPAVIIGDSKTGFTSTYHGLFLYLRLIAMLVPHQQRDESGKHQTPIRLPMNGDEPRNLVPVDWVSAVIAHVVCTPEAHGRTYHLTPEECSSARQVIDSCCNYFNSAGVEYVGVDAKPDADDEFSKAIFENTRIYESYETSDPEFDRTNVEKWAGHLPCPAINESMIHRFIEFGESNRWGKSRVVAPKVEYWFDDELERIGQLAESIVGRLSATLDSSVTIGLDIKGQGGGQWTLAEIATGIRIARGLPGEGSPILAIDGRHVAQLLDKLSSQDPESALGLFVDQFETTISLALR
jgi:thioester reductase-like protein